MWGRKKFFLSVPFGIRSARPLAAATQRVALAVDRVAAGLRNIPQDLRAIAGLEHNRLRVFPRPVHAFLLSCLYPSIRAKSNLISV